MALVTHWKPVPEPKAPVMEEYYGTSGNLEVALRALDKIVKEINAYPETALYTADIDSMKEVAILENALTKEFGFAKTLIHFDNASLPNAYTVVGGAFVNQYPGVAHMKKDSREKYYDKTHQYSCCICVITCLINRNKLTARETMGIILHEIGHNFDNQMSTFCIMLANAVLSVGIGEIVQALYHNFYIKGIKQLQDMFPALTAAYNLVLYSTYHLSYIIVIDITKFPLNPLDWLRVMFGAQGEYFSDSFAAKYGFGPDLASANMKLEDKEANAGYIRRAFYGVPAVRTLWDIIEGPFLFIGNVFDVHPVEEHRIMNIKENLVKDYQDSKVPAKFKPEIKKQIEAMDRIIEADQRNAQSKGLAFQVFRKWVLYSRNSPAELKKAMAKTEK